MRMQLAQPMRMRLDFFWPMRSRARLGFSRTSGGQGNNPCTEKTAVRKTSPNSAFFIKEHYNEMLQRQFFNGLLPSNLFGI
jgi:hypothetical protein